MCSARGVLKTALMVDVAMGATHEIVLRARFCVAGSIIVGRIVGYACCSEGNREPKLACASKGVMPPLCGNLSALKGEFPMDIVGRIFFHLSNPIGRKILKYVVITIKA